MIGSYFFDSSQILSIDQATIPIDNIYYAYGFGVYETLKIRKGKLYFPELHSDRLLHSAQILGIEHSYTHSFILENLKNILVTNQVKDSNIKIHLLGGQTPEDARLFIYQLAPLYPKREDKKNGAKVVLYRGERLLPEAKSMGMLLSSLAYQHAKKNQAHDSLLINHNNLVTEGTRTNIFYFQNGQLFTPPKGQVLHGVTRHTVLQALREADVQIQEKELQLEDIHRLEGFFLTSTSINILPIKQIEDHIIPVPPVLKKIQDIYNNFLKDYTDSLETLV